MSRDHRLRDALRSAERGASDDVSRLVAAVPRLMREAERRRRAEAWDGLVVERLATWAFPRVAVATVFVVLAAVAVIRFERPASGTAGSTFGSVVLDGDSGTTGDDVLDALLAPEGTDG